MTVMDEDDRCSEDEEEDEDEDEDEDEGEKNGQERDGDEVMSCLMTDQVCDVIELMP